MSGYRYSVRFRVRVRVGFRLKFRVSDCWDSIPHIHRTGCQDSIINDVILTIIIASDRRSDSK